MKRGRERKRGGIRTVRAGPWAGRHGRRYWQTQTHPPQQPHAYIDAGAPWPRVARVASEIQYIARERKREREKRETGENGW